MIALGVVLWDHYAKSDGSRRWAENVLGAMAVISVLAYFNFGLFHGRSYVNNWQDVQNRYVHQWDQFHYFLNSKYFPELGYDGLYAATLQAQEELFPQFPISAATRDPRSNQVVPTATLSQHQAEVRARFTPKRWAAFLKDFYYFVNRNGIGYIGKLRLDHGFNGTPAWTFIAGLLSSRLEAKTNTLFWLSMLDVGLLVLMFYTIYRSYGRKSLYLSIILFGLGYGWRFFWSGGSFLRQDWLAALVCGICMLKTKRYTLSGLLLAYAGASRVYPLLFLFAPVVLFIRSLVLRKNSEWLWPLATGLVVGIILCFDMGSVAGRGMSVWNEFGDNIWLHRNTWLTNNVGLRNVLLYDRNTYHQDWVDWGLAEPWVVWQANLYQIQRENAAGITLVISAFIAVLIFTVWQMELDEATILGVAATFGTLLLTCYYWGMLLLFGLRRRTGVIVGLLVMNTGLYAIHVWRTVFEVIYGAMSWGLLVIFLVYAFPLALKTLRRRAAV